MVLKVIFLHLILSSLTNVNGKQITFIGNSIHHGKNKNEFKKFNNEKPSNKKIHNWKDIKDPSTFCQSFQSCFECVNNVMYPCYWCHNYGCTDQANTLCPDTVAKMNTTHMKTDYLCPYIKHDGPILVPAGVRMNLKVKLHAPDPVIYDKEIICQVHFKQRLSHLKGLIIDDYIYCYPVTLETLDDGETNTGYLKIIWGGVEPTSNGIPVSVYDCENLADNCSDCRLIALEYGCGWCDKIKRCVIADKCGNSLMKWELNKLECKGYDRKLLYV